MSETNATLEIVFGPMFSGKTTELLRRLRIQEVSGRSVRLIKHSLDTRFSESSVVTHSKEERHASCMSRLLPDVLSAEEEVVGIDEGQFFEDVVEATLALLKMGKRVYISALDGDSHMRPFGSILQLAPHAEKFEKYSAVCVRCKQRPASFTAKLSPSESIVEVGGSELYAPTCRQCHTVPE